MMRTAFAHNTGCVAIWLLGIPAWMSAALPLPPTVFLPVSSTESLPYLIWLSTGSSTIQTPHRENKHFHTVCLLRDASTLRP